MIFPVKIIMKTSVIHRLFKSPIAVCSRSSSRSLATKAVSSPDDGAEYSTDRSDVVISPDAARHFIERCIRRAGANASHAQQLADVLVTADYRGHYSHGLAHLDMYVGDLKNNLTNLAGIPGILKETVSTALVDGNHLLGPVVGNYAMGLAITKAKATGIGWVATRASNHFGIAGYYALQAVRNDMIGLVFCNSSPSAAPLRTRTLALGTNALCMAAPAANGDYFAMDMAVSTVARGKVELAMRAGQKVPSSWGLNKEGQHTTNPAELFHGGSLLPLGGEESTGGYKGYGLNLMVEILCGILADAAFGPLVRAWGDPSGEANLGQCFGAIDVNCFGNGFQQRLSALLNIMRHMDPTDTKAPVLVPGDPERQHMLKCDRLAGIPYPADIVRRAGEIAHKLGVQPLL
ncbi:hypothetical protein RvY_03212 [Ramazzottius varieornatus]|uniref:Malate dehydrogenase n=1 Tax=Ramazzottius varieornatus TaxID=947166 RepID=A0A1D1UT17_RAMVA|nr:hypothetical protein RvY_03212 [Ramazzottius varieornatus]